jgi:hypothetical protein
MIDQWNVGGQILAYTLTGLNIDGSGGFNDSVVVNFLVTGDSQNLQTVVTGSNLPKNSGWLSSGAPKLDANGEFVLISNTGVTVNLNGGFDNGTGTWGGFTAASVGGFGATDGGLHDEALFNGILRTHVDDNTSKDFDLTVANATYDIGGGNTNDTSLLADFDTAAGAAGDWRPEAWSFEITAVPEPSSYALLAGLTFPERKN